MCHLRFCLRGLLRRGLSPEGRLRRLGVGELILVDPDLVEEKNLNRILSATLADVGRPKVEVVGDAIRRIGLGTRVVTLSKNLFEFLEGNGFRGIALQQLLQPCRFWQPRRVFCLYFCK